MKEMRKTIDSKYAVSLSLARLCEYMYRKGVKDAAEVFDENTVRHFLDSNDPIRSLAFIMDEGGRNLRPQFYAAIMSVRCYANKAKKAALLFDYGASKPALVHGACSLVNSFYRRGLEDGIGMDFGDASLLLNSYTGVDFERVKTGPIKLQAVISEMLTEALRLDADGFKPGYRIWKFINDGIIIKNMSGTFIYDEIND